MRSTLVHITVGLLLAVLAGLFVVTQAVQAGPAFPGEFILTQPDGITSFTARQWGDEWSHGIQTATGYTILQMADGWWVYAELDETDQLVPALSDNNRLEVGIDDPGALSPGILPPSADPNSMQSQFQAGSAISLVEGTHNTGNQPLLVILAEFSDRAGTYTLATLQPLIFGADYGLQDYFQEVSYGNLVLTPAIETHGNANDGVIGWVNTGTTHPSASSPNLEHQNAVKAALVAADAYIDYSRYDQDLDGYISQSELRVLVLAAGYETSFAGSVPSPSLYGHQWHLSGATGGPPNLDGVILGDANHKGSYVIHGEIHCNANNMFNYPFSIGPIAHDLGHDLGMPDLIGTDGTSMGVGAWSLMGTGGWGYYQSYEYGELPIHPDPLMKWYEGWITPREIYGTHTNLAIRTVEYSPDIYLLGQNPGGVDWVFNQNSGTGEYFLLEQRSFNSYNLGLYGLNEGYYGLDHKQCGVLIWHIDETRSYSDPMEDKYRMLIALEQADGLNNLIFQSEGDAGDPYPGRDHKYLFNNSTNPGSSYYTSSSGISVTVKTDHCADPMFLDITTPGRTLPMKTWLPLIHNPAYGWMEEAAWDFEGEFPGEWLLSEGAGSGTGEYLAGKRDCYRVDGGNGIRLDGGGAAGSGLNCITNSPDSVRSWMVSGPYDTTGWDAGAFDFYHYTKTETDYDFLCSVVSDNNIVYYGTCFSGNWLSWSKHAVNLDHIQIDEDPVGNPIYGSFLDKPSVWIGFAYITDNYIQSYWAYVDRVSLWSCTGSLCGSGGPSMTIPLFSLNRPVEVSPGKLLDLLNPFGRLFQPSGMDWTFKQLIKQ